LTNTGFTYTLHRRLDECWFTAAHLGQNEWQSPPYKRRKGLTRVLLFTIDMAVILTVGAVVWKCQAPLWQFILGLTHRGGRPSWGPPADPPN
jgi:hypothetical protein